MWVRKLSQSGGSKQIVVPSEALEALGWEKGDHVLMYLLDVNQLLLTKFDPARRPDLMQAAEEGERRQRELKKAVIT